MPSEVSLLAIAPFPVENALIDRYVILLRLCAPQYITAASGGAKWWPRAYRISHLHPSNISKGKICIWNWWRCRRRFYCGKKCEARHLHRRWRNASFLNNCETINYGWMMYVCSAQIETSQSCKCDRRWCANPLRVILQRVARTATHHWHIENWNVHQMLNSFCCGEFRSSDATHSPLEMCPPHLCDLLIVNKHSCLSWKGTCGLNSFLADTAQIDWTVWSAVVFGNRNATPHTDVAPHRSQPISETRVYLHSAKVIYGANTWTHSHLCTGVLLCYCVCGADALSNSIINLIYRAVIIMSDVLVQLFALRMCLLVNAPEPDW